MKRKNVLDILAAARPADLDLAGTSPLRAEELPAPVRARRARWVVVAASLATVSVIGAVAIPRLMYAGTATPSMVASTGHTLDGAADRAAETRQAPGDYWHTEGLILQEQVIGPPDGRYRIRTRIETSRWAPRDPGPYVVLTERGLPTVPTSPSDQEAWRRAGAPELCGDDTDCENDTAPLGRTRFIFMPGTWPYHDQGLTLSAGELLDLPRDPAVLKERLLSFWSAYEAGMAGWPAPPAGASLPTKDSWLLTLSLELLQTAPISGGTRAALYRMVADLPGTRALGQVRDAGGRLGVGVGWARPQGDGQSEQQLIVDESTGQVLSLQHVVVKPWSKDSGDEGLAGLPAGTVYHALVYQRATWTDTPPEIPAHCPVPRQGAREDCVE
ncbi:hypothetical protein Misp01_78980 [Microtetraspora sp. NBRC 13810]|uniref:CU044_5270 family protein n=1 Tax=Microtetraspora sp. NBRC 13810 TaxID=3030990 RepID=UPI0024A31943|nr:CU044_5270 family protein [Microtetraspora sp. NBRC 13810]GLW12770.1 hypothetical protein Misp01_78980 [Microtetraspora sp. NBRC 13810]